MSIYELFCHVMHFYFWGFIIAIIVVIIDKGVNTKGSFAINFSGWKLFALILWILSWWF